MDPNSHPDHKTNQQNNQPTNHQPIPFRPEFLQYLGHSECEWGFSGMSLLGLIDVIRGFPRPIMHWDAASIAT